jgi:threonine dehydrogenase-like Zn-dependent dehydrogenase
MKRLMMHSPGDLEWVEAPEPDLRGPAEALVRPLVAASCDLDGPIVRGETPIAGPIEFGHECVGEVAAVGSQVSTVNVGDRVIVPFQVSCGECEACRTGLTGNCLSVPERSMFGFGALGGDWGGMLSDLVRVPYADAMLVLAPPQLDTLALVSASDNLCDAWRTVAPHLSRRPGADVLVLGGGARSIALYATGFAVALGAGRVTYADVDPQRLAIASDLGADTVEGMPPSSVERHSIVVDGGASRESLACACRSTAPGGDCTHVGILYEPQTPVPLLEMYGSGLHLHVGRVMVRAQLPAVLDFLTRESFDPSVVTDRVIPFEQAGNALLEPHTKLVFSRV